MHLTVHSNVKKIRLGENVVKLAARVRLVKASLALSTN
jgi:hypothetical protein